MKHKKMKTLILFWIAFLSCLCGWIGIGIASSIVNIVSDGSIEKNLIVRNYGYSVVQEFIYDYVDFGQVSENNQLQFKPENTNLDLRFLVNGEEVFTNTSRLSQSSKLVIMVYGYEVNLDNDTRQYTLEFELNWRNAEDWIDQQFREVNFVLEYRPALYIATGIATLLTLIIAIFSFKYIGQKADGTYALSFFERIPLELIAFAFISLLGMTMVDEFWVLIFFITTLVIVRSLIVRINAGVLFKNSLINMLIGIITYSKNNHMGLSYIGLVGLIMSLISLGMDGELFVFVMILFWVPYFVITRAWIKHTAEIKVLQKLSLDIRSGTYTNTAVNLTSVALNDISSNLTEIQSGLDDAVQQQLKSERTKSELITNVSHDLKTPLTSIVNYVDLLKHEDLSPTQTEYLEVVDKQVHRLKKLTDDLFEAAKINTMDVELIKEPINLKVFWEQSIGEYEDKIHERNLELISKLDAVDVDVLADGKYLWRVIDNILRNLTLYAQEHTRVYIDGVLNETHATLSIKNISKDALNITEEELMERFVRGDSSRNTEGSGLGLSIARNIMEMLGGSFSIKIDGDLFKVSLCLPRATENELLM